jgi:leucyl/phenylalanyl-tRNA---protein transferase
MPVYELLKNVNLFPSAEEAIEEGLLAIGGDLSVERLLLAYSSGIFPWYSEGQPILWWSPDPRFVMFPKELKISKSLNKTINSNKFSVKVDMDFAGVIEKCAKVKRVHEKGTWITEEMKKAYIKLHNEGYAHSIETYYENKLVGGLYGVSLGRAFFGESMFHTMTDASKVALYFLVVMVKQWEFMFIDSQVYTEHLESMGACEISRRNYLIMLKEAMRFETKKGKWEIN